MVKIWYGYLGQLVLFYIFVNLFCWLVLDSVINNNIHLMYGPEGNS